MAKNKSKLFATICLVFLASAFILLIHAPQVKANNTNLAPINDGNWWTDPTWINCPAQNVFYDYSTTHNGAATFRVEAADSVSPNCMGPDHGGISLNASNHIVMTGWIKTTGSPAGQATGARIGLDYYGPNGRITGAASQAAASAGIDWPNAPSNIINADTANYVPWGSSWTFVTWDFIVPSTCTSDGLA